jgi:hypothetical protein
VAQEEAQESRSQVERQETHQARAPANVTEEPIPAQTPAHRSIQHEEEPVQEVRTKVEVPHVTQPVKAEVPVQRVAEPTQTVEDANEEEPEVQNQPLRATSRSGSKFDLQGQENAVLYRVSISFISH